ncbi:MAG: AzlD domain-containing protein [Pseudomonadota bacterium]
MTGSVQIWVIITALAVGTFFFRWSGLGLLGGRELPPWVLRHLRYTAVAILPGLIAPFVLWPPATGGVPDASRLAAAAVVFGLAVGTRNVVLAVISGFVALFAVQWAIG